MYWNPKCHFIALRLYIIAMAAKSLKMNEGDPTCFRFVTFECIKKNSYKFIHFPYTFSTSSEDTNCI